MKRKQFRKLIGVGIVLAIVVWFFSDIKISPDEYGDYRAKCISFKISNIKNGHGYICYLNEAEEVFCPPININLQATILDSLYKSVNNDTIWIYDKNGSFKANKIIQKAR